MSFKVRYLLLPFFLLLWCIFPTFTDAKEITVNAYVDNTTIGVDDVLRLTVEVSGENVSRVDRIELPDIPGISVTGSSTSSSSSFTVVGGRMTSSVTRSNVYTLRASSPGSYLIPPLTIRFEGKSYTTDPIGITVMQGSSRPAPPVSQQFRQPDPDSEQLSDNIFIIADVPKRTIYRGEPLVVRYKIYSRYDLANLSFVSEPNFIGFWKDDIFFANKMNFQRENYQGRVFNAMLLRTIALYPSQTGTLTIPAFFISADIIVRARSFWDFDSSRKVNLQSSPINVEVKELPAQGRPASFTGAVGNFRMTTQISETTVNVGDPVTLTVNVTGSGNLKQFDPPIFSDIPFLRILDPEVSTDTRVDGNRITGSKTIKYPAIVTRDGTFELPPLKFSFYDPANNNYSNLEGNAYQITAQPVSSPQITMGHSQQDVAAEGFDIFYIHRQANLKPPRLLLDGWFIRLLLLVIILTVPASYLYANERDKLLRDRTHLRQRLAGRILKKYLKLATEGVKSGDMSFYVNAANGLSNYLTDILKIPRGSTTETIISTMEARNFSHNSIERVNNILLRFMEARFKPGGFNKEMINSDYQELISVISEISSSKTK